jgi:hypothetical protein
LNETRSVQDKILQMVESGAITAAEATRLLDAAEDPFEITSDPIEQEASDLSDAADPFAAQKPVQEGPCEHSGPPEYWDSVWVYVFAGGAALAGLGAAFTIPIAQGNVSVAWLWLTVPAMALGTLLALITWWSRSSRWMHLRIQDEGKTIRFSIPIPLQLLGSSLRFVELFSPRLREARAGEMVSALASGDMLGEDLLYLDIDDRESGDQVRISIG